MKRERGSRERGERAERDVRQFDSASGNWF